MKSKLFILSIVFSCMISTIHAQVQNNIPEKKVVAPANVTPNFFRVLSINFVGDSTNTLGTTRHTYYTETIVYTGTGVATLTNYLTTRDANTRQYPNGVLNTSNTGTITLNGNGTDVLQIKKSAFVHSAHTLMVVINTPNQVTSNTIGF